LLPHEWKSLGPLSLRERVRVRAMAALVMGIKSGW